MCKEIDLGFMVGFGDSIGVGEGLTKEWTGEEEWIQKYFQKGIDKVGKSLYNERIRTQEALPLLINWYAALSSVESGDVRDCLSMVRCQ